MKITFISDTHTKHKQLTQDLPGGDLLIHAGDISSMGRLVEIQEFCNWFDSLDNYTHKVFIAGNHDWGFQNNKQHVHNVLNHKKFIDYLEDDVVMVGKEHDGLVKVYGSPWQPEFHNWAFNLPRLGDQLKEKWDNIPDSTDILITHGPAYGYCDKVVGTSTPLGCELLTNRIKTIKPKIHVCGHIHSGRGYMFDGDTHFINASVLDESYYYSYPIMNVDWNPNTNEIEFV